MSSRRYLKRVWRVPSDRGALERFAVLVKKLMRKHGWPAEIELDEVTEGFFCFPDGGRHAPLPGDFSEALEIAVRIIARTYRVDVTHNYDWIGLNRRYRVASGGHFREERG